MADMHANFIANTGGADPLRAPANAIMVEASAIA